MRRTIFLLFLLVATAGSARAEDADTFRRWGSGWDNGFAVRYRPSPSLGIGLSLNPGVLDNDLNSNFSAYESEGDLKDTSMSAAILFYQESPIGRWVRVGPFVQGGFSYTSSEGTETRMSAAGTQTTSVFQQARIWSVEVGIRPAFAIEDRFVLESRFGLIAAWSSGNSVDEVSVTGGSEDTYVRKDRGESWWIFQAVGTDLGFGSALQFIIYL